MSKKKEITNPIFLQIINSLETNIKDPILEFNEYKIIKNLGNGQQGIVLKVINKINKELAIKFYSPTDTSPEILRKGISNFKNEVDTTSKLSHKNLVKIFTGGTAIWNGEAWTLKLGFENETSGVSNSNTTVLFYIMEFIKGKDLTKIFPELADEDEKKDVLGPVNIHEKRSYFENLIRQVSKGIYYYNGLKVYHRDLKPQNIIYSEQDENYVIVDFGFASSIDIKEKDETIVRTKIIDWIAIEKHSFAKYDMGQFSKILLLILPSLRDAYDENRYKGLEEVIKRGCSDDLNFRYSNILELYTAAKSYFIETVGWSFQIKLNQFLTDDGFGEFNRTINIPVSKDVLVFDAISRIIDTPQFQRLRGVKQLGPTSFVFPGATHTRFEHSLGVYSLSLKYIEKVIHLKEFRDIAQPVSKTIKLIVSSALLHDIGHYPYSHWIEEIEKLPNNIGLDIIGHEKRAAHIIKDSAIAEILEKEWGIDPNEVCETIQPNTGNELANSFIDSVFDFDKLDYLKRDSIHCGVNYGDGIDTSRLLNSLYINKDARKLCITDKGYSYLLTMLSCRNVMYQEVYWHKTVRACEAMFKRFFYEYARKNFNNKEKAEKKLNSLFELPDEVFILDLYNEEKENKNLEKLIKPFAFNGRDLFKPVFIFFAGETSDDFTNTRKFFEKVIRTQSYDEIVEMSNKLTNLFSNIFDDVGEFDFLIEVTPVKEGNEFSKLDKIWNLRKKEFDNVPLQIIELNKYLKDNRRAFIFCNKKHYTNYRKKIESDKYFLDKILKQMI